MDIKRIYNHLLFSSDLEVEAVIIDIFDFNKPYGQVTFSPNHLPVIVINLATPRLTTSRLAFIIAHEIGHIVSIGDFPLHNYIIPKTAYYAAEYVADLIAVDLLENAGFDIDSGVQILGNERSADGRHPSGADRISNIKDYLKISRKKVDKHRTIY